ncbi:MAG: efflux RND transporter periplasmic adaptor subunit [Fimbriimonadaceae bacterium]
MRTILPIILAATALGIAGCVDRGAQAQAKRTEELLSDPVVPVKVITASTEEVRNTFEVTGSLTTSEDTIVGAKTGGRVVAVYVKDGDAVSAGQVLATIDTTDLQIQLRQANAQIQAAESQLSQAKSNAAVAPVRSNAAVAAAEAQLAQAKSQYEKARNGARTDEKAQAEAAVNAAKSNLDTAKSDLERQRRLFNEGATPKARLEQSENAYAAALSQYEQALAARRLIEDATRPEDLATASAAVRQAEENLRSAKAQQQLDVVYDQQVAAAESSLNSARAARDLVRQQIADATVRAPFSGQIAGKPVQVGQIVAPGTPIARLVGSEGLYFEGEIPESMVDKLRPGTPVRVTIASANRAVDGEVAAISPYGETVGRLFRVRIRILSGVSGLNPGMFATGEVLIGSIPDAVVLPYVAVVSRGGKNFVFVYEDGKARQTDVTLGLRLGDRVQVTGVSPGAQVVIEGQSTLQDGSDIRIDSGSATETKE